MITDGDSTATRTALSLRARHGRVEVQGSPRADFGYRIGDPGGPAAAGVWAEWRWDGTTLRARNDRYGFHPLFVHVRDDAVIISDSLVALLERGAPRTLDDGALAAFLRLGFFLGDRTPFLHIRVLPPGCRLAWTPDGHTLESFPPEPSSRPSLSRKQAIAAYGDIFQEAVERMLARFHGTGIVPLSGGRDSRHILLALAEAGRPPRACVTVRHFPPKSDEDARIAARLAAAVGVRHVTLPRAGDRFEAERRKNLLTHFCADEHAWMLTLADYLARERDAEVWDGIAGDVLSAGLFLNQRRYRLFDAGRLEELADDLLPGEGYLPSMLTAAAYGRWSREAALEEVLEELRRHVGAGNPIGQFFFWNRTRREIALGSWSILGARSRVLAPFLCPAVYDFLAELPASYFVDHTFHSEAIAERYPAFAGLPYELEDAEPTVASRREILRFVTRALAHGVRTPWRSSFVRPSFLIPKFARAAVDRRYGTRLPEIVRFSLYLKQLEEHL